MEMQGRRDEGIGADLVWEYSNVIQRWTSDVTQFKWERHCLWLSRNIVRCFSFNFNTPSWFSRNLLVHARIYNYFQRSRSCNVWNRIQNIIEIYRFPQEASRLALKSLFICRWQKHHHHGSQRKMLFHVFNQYMSTFIRVNIHKSFKKWNKTSTHTHTMRASPFNDFPCV